MSALALAAQALQGLVLRDAPLIEKLLERTTPGEPTMRRALVVGLGMLGAPPALELAWPDAEDVDQAVGYFAALSIGVDDPDADPAGRGGGSSLTRPCSGRRGEVPRQDRDGEPAGGGGVAAPWIECPWEARECVLATVAQEPKPR